MFRKYKIYSNQKGIGIMQSKQKKDMKTHPLYDTTDIMHLIEDYTDRRYINIANLVNLFNDVFFEDEKDLSSTKLSSQSSNIFKKQVMDTLIKKSNTTNIEPNMIKTLLDKFKKQWLNVMYYNNLTNLNDKSFDKSMKQEMLNIDKLKKFTNWEGILNQQKILTKRERKSYLPNFFNRLKNYNFKNTWDNFLIEG